VGIALRFLPNSSLWLDEALAANIADVALGDLTDALRRDGHPPLYYLLLKGWTAVFGTSDLALRSLSGVFGVVAMALAWFAGRRFGGERTAWAALGLMAISPYAIRYSSEVRPYSLIMVLVFAGYLLVDRYRRAEASGTANSVRTLVGIALVSGLLMLTHYWSFWLLGAVGLVVLWGAFRPADTTQRAGLLRLAAAIAAGAVLFAPWLPHLLHQSANTGTPWGAPVTPQSMVSLSLIDFGGPPSTEGVLSAIGLSFLVALGVLGHRSGSSLVLGERVQTAVVPLLAVIVLVVSVGTVTGYVSGTAFQGRYAAVFFPLFILVAARGLMLLDRWVLAVAAVVIGGVLAISALRVIPYDRTQADTIAATILADVSDQTGGAEAPALVVACPDQLAPALDRELRAQGTEGAEGETRLVTYPNLGEPAFVDWTNYLERHAASDPVAVAAAVDAEAGPAPVWLVWNNGYRSTEGRCAELVEALGRSDRQASTLAERNESAFENATITVFRKSG
jgi:hypothetical protein